MTQTQHGGPAGDEQEHTERLRAPEEGGPAERVTVVDPTELLARAQALYANAQSDTGEQRAAQVAEVDALLATARRTTGPLVVGQLLRYATLVRMVDDNGAPDAGPLLDEYEAYTRRHGLPTLLADTEALRAKRELAAGREDAGINAVARALAILDDTPVVGAPGADARAEPLLRVLGIVLTDVSVVLMALGVFEVADQTMRRAKKVAADLGDAHLEIVLNANNTFLLVEWGRRLERLGYPDTARQNYRRAAEVAERTEARYADGRFPVDPDRPVADQNPRLAAAHAYADPGAAHYARLAERLRLARGTHERIEMALPLARCMEHEGEYGRAVELLTLVADGAAAAHLPFPLLRVSLYRELARLTELAQGRERTGAVAGYVRHLEAELWRMRQALQTTLHTRREHERLARAHGTASAQALQDPLTELPNRRALAGRLATVSHDARNFPLAVALLDLDGFKQVNDTHSHARGDGVLRAVAAALRDVLRGDDLVARYGGDEFVAVLAGAPLAAAEAALGRALARVRALPSDVTLGVTLSVGVVSVGRDEPPASALGRADAAMYLAKRGGGDRVVAVGDQETPRERA